MRALCIHKHVYVIHCTLYVWVWASARNFIQNKNIFSVVLDVHRNDRVLRLKNKFTLFFSLPLSVRVYGHRT